MQNNSTINEAICPSFKCEEGSLLLGIRQKDGNIAILPKPLQIGQTFIDNINNAGLIPEEHFRFTNQCMKNDCKQWSNRGCGVAIRISHFFKSENLLDPIPECSLRSECRWHKQEGENICRLCPRVITNITADEVTQYFTNLSKTT